MTDVPHTNSTPDLDDEQYLAQLHGIAMAVSLMPGARQGLPDVTTPAPIRARWAAYLMSVGCRIDPELATHRLIAAAPKKAGSHGPILRTSLTKNDLWEVFKDMSPDAYEAVTNGDMTLDQLRGNISDEVIEALKMAPRVGEAPP